MTNFSKSKLHRLDSPSPHTDKVAEAEPAKVVSKVFAHRNHQIVYERTFGTCEDGISDGPIVCTVTLRKIVESRLVEFSSRIDLVAPLCSLESILYQGDVASSVKGKI